MFEGASNLDESVIERAVTRGWIVIAIMLAVLALVGAATVANMAGRDGRFFQRLRDGKTCSVDTLNHLLQWFSDHWPADAQWPDGVPRPAPAKEAA